ncbi:MULTISPECIES: DUF6124 family protein [unclassified Pseudomonas]|jgi:hypothetical protein|uniref:DUF6124 family protein n=1 Tax=unclassified Pseudomonas TaxID=196821 RepID=UPI00105507C2|nr:MULTISPECIES: DUF3077 domain-containing protein [unclassified Pseudomonas]MBW3505199.1 DUF3077 domain-containing protein [Pseudomonas sp. NKUCC02_KPG]MEC4166974.1 DUF3077 domain-containing protein [Pseudomonas sp. MS-1(2024)]
MTSLTKSPQKNESDSELDSLKDTVATQRALDYYLKPSVSQHTMEKKVFQVSSDVSQEEALLHASDYLRCGIASAHGAAEHLHGPQRDLLLSLAFFMESSKQLVDRAIDVQPLSAH